MRTAETRVRRLITVAKSVGCRLSDPADRTTSLQRDKQIISSAGADAGGPPRKRPALGQAACVRGDDDWPVEQPHQPTRAAGDGPAGGDSRAADDTVQHLGHLIPAEPAQQAFNGPACQAPAAADLLAPPVQQAQRAPAQQISQAAQCLSEQLQQGSNLQAQPVHQALYAVDELAQQIAYAQPHMTQQAFSAVAIAQLAQQLSYGISQPVPAQPAQQASCVVAQLAPQATYLSAWQAQQGPCVLAQPTQQALYACAFYAQSGQLVCDAVTQQTQQAYDDASTWQALQMYGAPAQPAPQACLVTQQLQQYLL